MALTKVSYSMIDGAAANVVDFGAVGDGVTDDTPAILSAISYLQTKGGGALYFPEGVYYLHSGSVYLDLLDVSNITFFGTGAASILKFQQRISYFSGVSNIAFVGLHFQTDRAYISANPGAPEMSFVFSAYSDVLFDRCLFTNSGYTENIKFSTYQSTIDANIKTGDSRGAKVTNCVFVASGSSAPVATNSQFAIRVWSDFENVAPGSFTTALIDTTIENCSFYSYYWNCVEFAGAGVRYGTVSNCYAKNVGITAFDLDKGCKYIIVDSCITDGVYGNDQLLAWGINIAGYVPTGAVAEDCIVSNCIVRNIQTRSDGEATTGINLSGTKNCTVKNCNISFAAGGAMHSGIRLTESMENFTLSGVTFTNAYAGLYEQNRGLITGTNTFEDVLFTTTLKAPVVRLYGRPNQAAPTNPLNHTFVNWVGTSDLSSDVFPIDAAPAPHSLIELRQDSSLTTGQVIFDSCNLNGSGTPAGSSFIRMETYRVVLRSCRTDMTLFTSSAITQTVLRLTVEDPEGTGTLFETQSFTASVPASCVCYPAYDSKSQYKTFYGSAAPTNGLFNVGTKIINTAPSAGGSIGWVHTSGGWKTFGDVAP